MSTATRWACIIIAVCVALSAVNTQAGPLPFDPNGLGGPFQGTQPFFGNVGPFTISANVDFSVYAPGHFNLSYPGQDPSGGTQFVYAYEVFNTGTMPATASPISIFTEGLLPNSAAANIEALPLVAGQQPDNSSFTGLPPTSARWDYTVHNLGLGANSWILLYTSPHGPTFQPGSVQGGGLSNTQNLPSPVPEPSTLILLAIGGSALLMFRRRMSGN
jgi:hypothetical protein